MNKIKEKIKEKIVFKDIGNVFDFECSLCGERVMKDEDVKHCNKHLAEKDKEIEKLKKELDTANCFVEGFSQFGLEELTENRKLNELWQKRFDKLFDDFEDFNECIVLGDWNKSKGILNVDKKTINKLQKRFYKFLESLKKESQKKG